MSKNITIEIFNAVGVKYLFDADAERRIDDTMKDAFLASEKRVKLRKQKKTHPLAGLNLFSCGLEYPSLNPLAVLKSKLYAHGVLVPMVQKLQRIVFLISSRSYFSLWSSEVTNEKLTGRGPKDLNDENE